MGSGLAAVGTLAPVDDFCFVDCETGIVTGGQAGAAANRAIHIDRFAAGATDEVMVVVSDAVFVEGGGAGRLDAADDAFFGQGAEGVVNGLFGDGADGGPGAFCDGVCSGVGVCGNGFQNGHALGSHG